VSTSPNHSPGLRATRITFTCGVVAGLGSGAEAEAGIGSAEAVVVVSSGCSGGFGESTVV